MRTQKFRSVIAAALALTMTGFGLLAAEASTPAKVPTAKVVQKLLWSQEFNAAKGKNVDFKFWRYDLGTGEGGWGNREKQSYVSSAVKTDGAGRLVINAKHHCTLQPQDGFPLCLDLEQALEQGDALTHREFCSDTDTQCQWTSGRINTRGKIGFKYGRMEARIQMPAGDGTWPAFWMLGGDLLDGVPWPECGEIDIMEFRGDISDRATHALHGPTTPKGSGLGAAFLSYEPLSSGFHTYAIEWKKDRIDFIVDGRVNGTFTVADTGRRGWVYNQEFFLILNLAMGGTYAGEYIDPTLNQAQLSVDYIRFYSVNGVGKVLKK